MDDASFGLLTGNNIDAQQVKAGSVIFRDQDVTTFPMFKRARLGMGYLPQEVYGYALASFAAERGEIKPEWARHLSTNVRAYFKRSSAWLAKNASLPATRSDKAEKRGAEIKARVV